MSFMQEVSAGSICSHTIIVLLSIAAGINIVEGGWDQWVIGGLLAYIMFDVMSEGKY